jgi:hypothetical protein
MEVGTDMLIPSGRNRAVLRVGSLASALLTRSPQSQTVPFGGAALHGQHHQ